MTENKMTEEKAAELLQLHFHCSQVVMKHFATRVGIDEDSAVKMVGALGAGCYKGGTCGVITSGSAVLGMVYGFSKENSSDQNVILKAKVREFQDKFIELNDKLLCKELLGLDLGVPEEALISHNEGRPLKLCPKFITDACNIIDDMLDEDNK